MSILRCWAVLCVAFFLFACGGGGGSSTGAGNSQNPPVSTQAVQTDNNLLVRVEDGPRGSPLVTNVNILYATVKVCHPLSGLCVDIDHVQVDTGSVGLRVLASKVKSLGLPALQISSNPVVHAWECFPFVIGGLWGANAKAVVGLGRQKTREIAIQLIEDDPGAALQPTADCIAAADKTILSSAGALGSNGILGVGSTNLDCGNVCVDGSYAVNATFVQYYGCPPTASSSAGCSTNAKVGTSLQVSNPVSAFSTSAYSNGMVLTMPAVSGTGAASASGELIFGVDTVAGSSTLSNNTVPSGVKKVLMGVDWTNKAAYLNITTQLQQGAGFQTFARSYLDTGTNGLFFSDSPSFPVARCAGSTWYCPVSAMTLNAVLSDGGSTSLNPVGVQFQVGNADSLFPINSAVSGGNTAFANVAGAAPAGPTSFAWGMPFFYGKRVYMSIWNITGAVIAPWYAWTAL